MYQLVVLCIFDTLTGSSDSVFDSPTDFETSAAAELRALLWLHYRPHDIVMLLEAP